MKKKQNDKKFELLENQMKVLLVHFDTIQIFASKHDAKIGNTATFVMGHGDWNSRYGQVRQWAIKQDVITAQEGVREAEEENS